MRGKMEMSVFLSPLLCGMRRGGNECFYLTFLLITMNFGEGNFENLVNEKRYSDEGKNSETWKFFTSTGLLR